MATYDAVIFDNDGVLTTPTDRTVLDDCIAAAFRDAGVDAPTDDDVRAMVHSDLDTVEAVCEAHAVEAAALWRAREENAVRVQREEIRAGNKTLYDDCGVLADLPVPLAIVSNNQHETIEFIVEHFELETFEVHYGREPTLDGISRKKPEPYYLERAIADLGASNPLYVGDSNVDVAAAERAGVDSAFIRRPHREGYELRGEPTYEVETLDEVATLVRATTSS